MTFYKHTAGILDKVDQVKKKWENHTIKGLTQPLREVAVKQVDKCEEMRRLLVKNLEQKDYENPSVLVRKQAQKLMQSSFQQYEDEQLRQEKALEDLEDDELAELKAQRKERIRAHQKDLAKQASEKRKLFK